jgi:hypothetical protein
VGKVLVEFINTCPCCDAYGRILENLAKKYPDDMELKLYSAGGDMSYVAKYGMVTRGTMIINGKDKYEEGFINKRIIEEAVLGAMGKNK